MTRYQIIQYHSFLVSYEELCWSSISSKEKNVSSSDHATSEYAMTIWERESLLLTFGTWKKYTVRSKRNVESTAPRLGVKVVLRYCFKRWRENQLLCIQTTNLKLERARTKMKEFLLMSNFSKWFQFSRYRGRRMRLMRKCWDDWLSHSKDQIQERQVFSKAVSTIRIVKKYSLLIQLRSRLRTISELETQQRKKIQGCSNPRSLYLLSLWINNTPTLMLKSCWKAVSHDASTTLLYHTNHSRSQISYYLLGIQWRYKRLYVRRENSKTEVTLLQKKPLSLVPVFNYDGTQTYYPNILSNLEAPIIDYSNFLAKKNYDEDKKKPELINSISDVDGTTMEDISVESPFIDTTNLDNKIGERKTELIKSISHVNNISAKKKFAERNIAVQKRTLKRFQRDIQNHCCKCGGNHCSIDHTIHQNKDCKALKMKQQVFTYLQQSLNESIIRLRNLESSLEMVKQENRKASVKLNDSLISYIECSCLKVEK